MPRSGRLPRGTVAAAAWRPGRLAATDSAWIAGPSTWPRMDLCVRGGLPLAMRPEVVPDLGFKDGRLRIIYRYRRLRRGEQAGRAQHPPGCVHRGGTKCCEYSYNHMKGGHALHSGAGSSRGDVLGRGYTILDAPADDESCAVRDALHGNPAAFALFFDRYGQRAYRSAVFLLGSDRADAEDVVQDTFIDALRGLRGYRPSQPFYPWLYTILRRRVIRQRRMRRRCDRPGPVRANEDGGPSGSAPDPTEDADLSWALSCLPLERR